MPFDRMLALVPSMFGTKTARLMGLTLFLFREDSRMGTTFDAVQ